MKKQRNSAPIKYNVLNTISLKKDGNLVNAEVNSLHFDVYFQINKVNICGAALSSYFYP